MHVGAQKNLTLHPALPVMPLIVKLQVQDQFLKDNESSAHLEPWASALSQTLNVILSADFTLLLSSTFNCLPSLLPNQKRLQGKPELDSDPTAGP